MIPLDELNVLVTMVVEPGLVENRIIPLMEPISQDKLGHDWLNQCFVKLQLAKSVGFGGYSDRQLKAYRELFEGGYRSFNQEP